MGQMLDQHMVEYTYMINIIEMDGLQLMHGVDDEHLPLRVNMTKIKKNPLLTRWGFCISVF
jgi:hypothetical protein